MVGQLKLPRCTKKTVHRLVKTFPNMWTLPKLYAARDSLKTSAWPSAHQLADTIGEAVKEIEVQRGIRKTPQLRRQNAFEVEPEEMANP